MAKCNCGAQTCGCVILAGSGVTVTGAGTPRDPKIISAEGGGGSTSGWEPGDLKDTARSVTDPGWLDCNGQAVSRTTYSALFDAIGTAYGSGDGASTFNVPNFTGIFRVGAGPGYAQGASGGTAANVISILNLPPHTHGMTHAHTIDHNHEPFQTKAGDGDHAHNDDLQIRTADGAGTRNDTVARASTGGSLTRSPLDWTGPAAGAHRHEVNPPNFTGVSGSASSSNTGSAGSGLAMSNLPPYRAVRVLIRT